ncbi:ATP-binding cassette domain-containing protein [Streptomyces sp. R41]|uniref:ATP-binding cassette domain-containing protein n=1 Tax=Streptomyces sp. R41 TaxID=3238632 RepID=A0AB39R4C2_9ACTN
MTPEAVVRLRGITKSFGGAAALKGVDLDLYPGEIHALMGMNGAGKSTLVQVLSGVHQADGGTIEVNGHMQHGLTVRKARRLGIASVPQRRELAMGLTVAENVMLGDLPTRRGAVHWRALKSEARQALSSLGIGIDVERIAAWLTVAEQTMVEVAREVRRGGRVLILDEPTACLSAEAAHQIRDLVRTLRDEGVAVVYISHYIPDRRRRTPSPRAPPRVSPPPLPPAVGSSTSTSPTTNSPGSGAPALRATTSRAFSDDAELERVKARIPGFASAA